jgi:hypothetical protein
LANLQAPPPGPKEQVHILRHPIAVGTCLKCGSVVASTDGYKDWGFGPIHAPRFIDENSSSLRSQQYVDAVTKKRAQEKRRRRRT